MSINSPKAEINFFNLSEVTKSLTLHKIHLNLPHTTKGRKHWKYPQITTIFF